MFRTSAALFLLPSLPLLATALLVGCSKPVPSEEPIRAVKVVTVGVESMHSGAEFAGEVRARVESRLGFRVAGKLVRRQAELGQRVKKGDILAQLDAQDYQLGLQSAKAQLAAATTNRDLAAADFKRFQELRAQNFISNAELERREAALKAAQAQVDQAQAQGTVQGNQAGYARLMADVSGVITAVEAEPGQVLAAGTPVVRIAQDGPRDVVFSVPEDRVGMIQTDSQVDVRAWGSDSVARGQVREVAASADPVTRTFVVKVSLDPQRDLPLGSTVSVMPHDLSLRGIPVIKLPTSALRQEGKSTAVWLLDSSSMTVQLQPVTVATADGNEVVLTEGLQPGMQVVTAGVHVLSPGQKVTIYKEKPATVPVDRAGAAIKRVASPSAPGSAPETAASGQTK
jgi:multidrug efflux system membrane fusion protein